MPFLKNRFCSVLKKNKNKNNNICPKRLRERGKISLEYIYSEESIRSIKRGRAYAYPTAILCMDTSPSLEGEKTWETSSKKVVEPLKITSFFP